MENGGRGKGKDWLFLKVFGQEVDLAGNPGLRQPDQLCGQIQLVGSSWGELLILRQSSWRPHIALHCMTLV